MCQPANVNSPDQVVISGDKAAVERAAELAKHRGAKRAVLLPVMAVLAIPFSLSAGKRGAIAGVAVAVGIAVVYSVVSRLFEAMGNLSQLPPALAAWSPDLIFAFFGGYLILKVPT